ncbi:iron(III) transport system permease protein [Rhodococcus sp. LBL1]|uniref:Iron(III) transport system permease protein n=1 Tax=Prescottella agglutinans TaxID=1644129 RepID=A0ABT6MDV4_9NOCA|nr:iron ABC transporter permease [Prescottella agglutinans]MDH6282499.1 iron(III) transport system permease protein [Prescottella agglutinans]MDH6679094.1 iron(III) transport system permease protein [Rhodococcus sp. LBL1]MDH6685166.1 iron(III) transport system permease protein [Rhodococcus sp. LBL2]
MPVFSERIGGRAKPRPPLALVVIVAALVAVTLIPLGYVVTTTISTGWETASALIFRPRVGDLMVNTVSLVVVTLPICAVLGVGAAWLVERTTVAGFRWWGPVLAAPLAVPAFVNSYAWVTVIPSMHGLWSGVLVATLSYFPLVALPVAAALRRLDPAVEESARALGSGPWAVFFRVVIPQLRLPILGGSLLISLHLLAEYGAFAMLRFDTFTTAILEQFQSTFNGAAGSMLASVLVVCCLVLLIAESGARGSARYARIGSGAPRQATRVRLRWSAIPAALSLTGLTALALGVPVWTIVRWLRIGGSEVWQSPRIWSALSQTLTFGIAGALVATALAFPVAWLAVRWPGVLSKIVEGTNYVTSSLPGIVTALALITVTIRYANPLYQTTTMVIVAYVLMFLPRSLVSLRSGLAQVPVGLEEASAALGKPPAATFWRVTLRLTAPSAAVGAALVFMAVATELTATLLLAPTGTSTLSTRFWALTGDLDYAAAAPYALLMIVLSLPMTYLLFSQSRKAAGA